MNRRLPNQGAAPKRRLRFGPAPWTFGLFMSQGSAFGELGRYVHMKPLATFVMVVIAILLALSAVAQAQDYTYTSNNSTITITKYTGPGGDVIIPSTIDGLPVTRIGDSAFSSSASLTAITIPKSVGRIVSYAFYGCASLTNVTIPSSVTSVDDEAFGFCSNLVSAFFLGNAPADLRTQFWSDPLATVYYLPGTVGWGSTFGSVPAMLLSPKVMSPGIAA